MLKEPSSLLSPSLAVPPSRPQDPASKPTRLGRRSAAALLAFGIVSVSRAEFDAEKYLLYSFGELSLRPRLDVLETYDSNLFYTDRDRVDDFITRVQPGLGLVYGSLLENSVSLSYRTDITRHMSRDDLDYLGHIVSHQSRIRLARVSIQAQDSFAISRSTLGGTFSYIQRPVGLTTLDDDWRFDYDLSPRTLVGGGFQFNWVDYDAGDLGRAHLYDFMSYSGSVRAGYRPSEKIVFFPQISYSQSFLSKNQSIAADAPDMSAVGFSVGAQGEFSPKITGLITAGYEIREYEDSTDVPDGWITTVEARWQARAKTQISLGYRHWIQVSREASGIAFTIDRPYLSINQQIGTEGRWNIIADGYFQLQDHTSNYGIFGATEKREDELFGAGLSASYRWTPWFITTARYDFSSYTDNIASIPDYDVHRFTLRLSAGF